MTDSQKGAPLSNQSALELLIAELDQLHEQVELWDLDMDAICAYVEAGEFVSRLRNITSEHIDPLMSEIEVVGGGPGRLADFIGKISKLDQSIWDKFFDGGESLTNEQLLTEVDSDRIFFKYAQSRKRGEMVLDRSEQSQSQALRFAAMEYRQIASLDSDWHLQRERAWRLQLQVSGTVLRLFENGKLVGMPDVESAILKTKRNHERTGNKNTMGLWKSVIWIQMAGYFDEERAVTIEEYEEHDGLRLEVKWVSLCPGVFGKRYPDIFRPLSVEDSKEGLDREVLWQEFHFEIMNYYAKSCELLADYIEQQEKQTVSPVVVAADPVVEDGLCSSSRVLTWGGVRYPLTPNQMAAVKVLYDAYSKGKPDVGLEEMKNKCDSAALLDSFAKVFQVKRKGLKSYNPVLGVIESSSQGTYRLKDPKKV